MHIVWNGVQWHCSQILDLVAVCVYVCTSGVGRCFHSWGLQSISCTLIIAYSTTNFVNIFQNNSFSLC